MPTEELFGTYTKRKLPLKMIAIGAVALAVLVGAGYAAYRWSIPVGPTADEILTIDVRDNTVMMLNYRTYSGGEFQKQILGRGRLERYIKVIDEAYFTYPQAPDEEFDEFVKKNFLSSEAIEQGKLKDGEIWLGDYHAPPSPDFGHFFRTSITNIKIEPRQKLKFGYKDVTYEPTLEELLHLTDNSMIYGGRMITKVPERTFKPNVVFANHGIMVAKPGEPSLERLAQDLLKNVPPDRESRIQRLTDFVSNEIEYSYAEAYSGGETLKRGDETLMTRNGDCSNKTILLASLLEQIGEEYLLLYCPHHITVAVPQGNFANHNKLDFTWNQRNWMIAETTLPGFQIGKTLVNDSALLTHVEYVQEPKSSRMIIDANSFEMLDFY